MKKLIQLLNLRTLRTRVVIYGAVTYCLLAGIPNGPLLADPAPQANRWEDDDAIIEIEALNKESLRNQRANLGPYIHLMDRNEGHRRDMSWKVLQMFKDQAAVNGARACAADWLGNLRMENAINDLAVRIDFRFTQGFWNHDLSDIPDFGQFPAQQALIKIGIPSIPALIGNLAQSDDAQVRKLSLEAIYRIEGDKDIVQIRLQKAAKPETDPKKQARLQAALTALDEAKF